MAYLIDTDIFIAAKVKYMTPWQMLRTERARFVLQQLATQEGAA